MTTPADLAFGAAVIAGAAYWATRSTPFTMVCAAGALVCMVVPGAWLLVAGAIALADWLCDAAR